MVGRWKDFIKGKYWILLFSAKAEIELLDEKTLLSLLSLVPCEGLNDVFSGLKRREFNAF